MITDKGAHAEMPLSLAISAISNAFTPPLLCAFSISTDKRLGESLAGVFTVGGMVMASGESGCPGVFPACG